MPPQPGLFPLAYPAASHTVTHIHKQGPLDPQPGHITYHPHPAHHHPTQPQPPLPHGVVLGAQGSSGPGRTHASHPIGHGVITDDAKREKRRRELAGKLGKEMTDRRDDGRHYHETVSALHSISLQLATRPETNPLYNLRLLPLTIERAALLAQVEWEERYELDCAEMAYEEEQRRVEDEWKRGRTRLRERLMEGIEERRRRAREEKEGEGTGADATLDSTTRPHITRKLRNKLGTSPPPTPLCLPGSALANGAVGLISSLPITTGPFLNPHSLSVDELPSPFPMPLTSSTTSNGANGTASGTGGGGGGGGRRRPKGNGSHHNQIIGGLGKSLGMLSGCKDSEIEADLNEIRRGNKRRRATAASLGKTMI